MNFARRQECNKCGAPKPEDAGFGGGGLFLFFSFSKYKDILTVLLNICDYVVQNVLLCSKPSFIYHVQIVAAEEDLEVTEVEASGAAGVSVEETVGASEAAIEVSEVATKWEEGMLKI